MSGKEKRAPAAASMKASAQLSILSFFGKGDSTAPSPSTEVKLKPCDGADYSASASRANVTLNPTTKRRIISSTAKEAIDVATATPVATFDRTPCTNTKGSRKAALSPGGGNESSDVPSPGTDGDDSPAVVPTKHVDNQGTGGKARPTKRSRVDVTAPPVTDHGAAAGIGELDGGDGRVAATGESGGGGGRGRKGRRSGEGEGELAVLLRSTGDGVRGRATGGETGCFGEGVSGVAKEGDYNVVLKEEEEEDKKKEEEEDKKKEEEEDKKKEEEDHKPSVSGRPKCSGSSTRTHNGRKKRPQHDGVDPNRQEQGDGGEGGGQGGAASEASVETDGEGGCGDDDDGSDFSSVGGKLEGDGEEGADGDGGEGAKDELSAAKERGYKKRELERKEGKQGEGAVEAGGGLSQYELERLERMKRNHAFMATLGLATAKPPAAAVAATSSEGGKDRSKNKKRSRPVSRAREQAAVVSVRRSARARGAEAVDYSEDKQAINAIATPARAAVAAPLEPEPILEEIDFDDSTVLKYLCGTEAKNIDNNGSGSSSANASKAAAASSLGAAEAVPEGARVVGLRVLDSARPLAASGLSTIYTMHFCVAGTASGGRTATAPPLLAAGGKGGIVALFSTRRQRQKVPKTDSNKDDEEEDERTLINFKAHKGWVSAVRFLEGSGGGAAGGFRLLTSANDSVVNLWDTSKQHRGFPRLLSTIGDLHPTRKGIFSMDSHGTRVATGSKDTTVAIAYIRPTGIELDRVLGDPGGSPVFHEKVVKGISLRDENTVASCGDDSNVRVSDLRSPSPSSSPFGVSHRLNRVHGGRACHTVRWHPLDGNLLLSAGLDSTVNLYDLRHLAAPLHLFRGHCPLALPRPRAIHRPEFIPSGKCNGVNIITCGERSDKLSMYDASCGASVSRGVLGEEASALAVGVADWSDGSPGAAGIAAALPGGSVVLLEPVWGSD